MANAVDFLVKRGDLRESRFVDAPAPDEVALEPGTVLLTVDRFAFTANNVTYAVYGERMQYWDFFPAPPGWGRIPVWGFGTVVRSACDGVPEGTRYYGYFPMSSYAVMRPERVSEAGFSDGASHRAHLHPLYNQYAASPDRGDDRADALQMLLRPLFITSFALDDLFAENDFYGARTVVLSSASSKTTYGLAFLLAARKRAGAPIDVVGLTSERNAAFVRSLGVYDSVVPYDRIASMAAGGDAVFIDMAGDTGVRAAVHHRFGEGLRYSCAVGFSHWEQDMPHADATLPGAKPEFFFAPARIKQRAKEWGPGGFEQRLGAAWDALVAALATRSDWLRVVYGQGTGDVERVYRDTLDGRVTPDEGQVLSLDHSRRSNTIK